MEGTRGEPEGASDAWAGFARLEEVSDETQEEQQSVEVRSAVARDVKSLEATWTVVRLVNTMGSDTLEKTGRSVDLKCGDSVDMPGIIIIIIAMAPARQGRKKANAARQVEDDLQERESSITTARALDREVRLVS
mmetsp:Transcript_79451/g.256848  ORF Transcript_79451/g.256848 Transcript_79451/m.256848 type:complete len:135 (+) Transcript_79451:749-1153(+)